MIRAYRAKLLGIDIANIKVDPAEIGGGFGGKTLIYLEPVAVVLSRKSGRPVKIADDARRRIPRLRPDLGRDSRSEDRRHAGRHRSSRRSRC